MKKILFFARDPGGANSLLDIISESKLLYKCDVYAKDFACTIFANDNIEFKEVIEIDNILNILDEYDLIFTGTSYLDYNEHNIWEKSSSLGIECIAYLDHWMGYERFFDKNKDKYILPKILIVTDNIAKEKILDKFKEFNIEVEALGSTFLQQLYKTRLNDEKIKKLKIKKKLESYDEIIVYAAEVIKDSELEHKYGFNEYTQFKKLYDSLKNLDKSIKLFFIPHPKHNLKDVESELADIIHSDNNFDIEIAPKDNLVQLATKVFGINTVVLVEALIYKIPSCSIQIGIKEPSDFELLKRNMIFNANTVEKLSSFIGNNTEVLKYDVSNIENSLENIMNLIELKTNNEKI